VVLKAKTATECTLVAVAALVGWLIFKHRRRLIPENKDTLKMLYFQTGLQYYISARYSAIAGFIPISGNLFHLAFEMFIKGYLTQDLSELERIKLRHRLKTLWKLYKEKINDPALDRFDPAVASLDRFEDIRYPERVARRGMTGLIDFGGPGPAGVITRGGSPLPSYRVTVSELDELMKLIFVKSNVNLTALIPVNPDASEYLNR
jgi:hypothetical protein